ncbi:TraM recognition domain-containing protein [Sinorhizobium medicae]|nr:type IV secretory system conjugative DNA transfer family protein [Sinorhizobium medicae]MDX0445634.1 TraM recognition domain-containing protein [Sinorhizobium medicae]MDX0488510.1 TraM recognition domain-containing protein [Sinorhizobium medicae]MDX0871096.1 TraM recognition domain-containing protein [Sinorhizobium medicae]MDX0877197.1 TraM recognition domain-containing protein [Sinorhizobium medicae]
MISGAFLTSTKTSVPRPKIYGETSRHSLLGNCGYQLVLGANDQATAEYAFRALGKRTIRYQSESRTIELMGLPRRTKVEHIRERDLMMPQEVRQMPENKMVLLIEGQRPIFGEKLRFFQTQPFKSAEAYSQANIPQVPEVDYFPPKAVPATTPQYANGGKTVRNSLAGASERGEAFGSRRGGGSTAQGSHCSRRETCSTCQTHSQ